jgi:hypothetical protein
MRRSAFAAAVLLGAAPLEAQVPAPWEGGTTASLGQPRPWKWTLGAGLGRPLAGSESGMSAEARLGLYHDLLNPMLSLAGLHGEAYVGTRAGALDHGVRLRAVSPVARLGIGADYNLPDQRARLVLSLQHPGRRGGVFRDGSSFRLDYVPGLDHRLTLAVETPALRRIPMGRTRPRLEQVRVPRRRLHRLDAPQEAGLLEPALAAARVEAEWIRRLTVPFLDHDGRNRAAAEAAVIAEIHRLKPYFTAASGGGARDAASATHRFHLEVERAFVIALSAPYGDPATSTAAGRVAAEHVRAVLLDHVLLPYNRLLGQSKKHDSVRGYGDRARTAFLHRLHTDSQIPPDRYDTMLWILQELVEIVEDGRAASLRQWQDSRFVWLPLQYALKPDEHDTQAKLDALIERAAEAEFTEGNFVSYIINEQFQYHLHRTIRSAEDYHVLWTHDFRGYDAGGAPDEMSYRHVLGSYLAAMTERVRAYDRTGRFPVYIILLDEWFYQVNRSRFWLNLLEDPLEHTVRLPPAYAAWQDSIAAAQATLREAVAASALLQRQRRDYGDKWLRNLIKVHVNITNPADPSFWSMRVLPFVPLPDNMMRDHRKVVFYDITEADPYRGEALYTGAGVGEHYANLSWEDRSLLVRGPAALGLKQAAREALLNQNIAPRRIPHPLQPLPRASDYEARVRQGIAGGGQPIRALEIHNATGFDTKRINVAKAMLYTLMPPGSVIKIPDSLWNSAFWGSTLVGCALRGVRVLVIVPAADNAPAPGFGTLGRSQELLWRLITASRLLEDEIAVAGGLLRTGIFAPTSAVTDIPAKLRAARQTFADESWLRELFGFPAPVYAGLGELADQLETISMSAPSAPAEFEYDAHSKLHLKANFFASYEGWQLMTRPEWSDVTWEFVQQRVAQVQGRASAVDRFHEFPEADAFIDLADGMVQAWFDELDVRARERVIFYVMMGSHNQNYRSMVIDGEVSFIMSGWPAVIPYLDLISLVGQSRWVSTPDDLHGLLPVEPEWRRRLGRWSKLVM